MQSKNMLKLEINYKILHKNQLSLPAGNLAF